MHAMSLCSTRWRSFRGAPVLAALFGLDAMTVSLGKGWFEMFVCRARKAFGRSERGLGADENLVGRCVDRASERRELARR